VSGEPLARGGSGTQGKISDTAKRKQLVVGFIVIMVIGTFGGDIVVILVIDMATSNSSSNLGFRLQARRGREQKKEI
jgi:hypothetical protein